MSVDKALLQTRLSIVMVRENYNFLNTLRDFQIKLKKYFNFEYTEDEIETALHQMEEAYIIDQFDEDQEKALIEYPEDYKF